VIAIALVLGYVVDGAVWTTFQHAADNTQTAYTFQSNGG